MVKVGDDSLELGQLTFEDIESDRSFFLFWVMRGRTALRSKRFDEMKSSYSFKVPTSGQIVVEYVLLLVIGVTVALIITSLMVSRNPESPGFIIQKWVEILQVIGGDSADDIQDQ